MSASTQPRRQRGIIRFLKVTLRHTLIHALNVALYLFMVALVFIAGLLIYLISRDDIPLPDFILRRIEARLAQSGLEATFSSARLDLKGGVLIRDLKLEPARFGEPVIEAGLVFLNFDELFLAAGMIELTEARLEGVTVLCPSAISPSGTPYPLVQIAGLSLERAGRAWNLHGLVARSGPLHVAIHGTITPPMRRDPPRRIPPGELIDQFARYAPQMVKTLQRLEDLREPRAEISFEVTRSGEIRVDVEAAAAAWSHDRIGELLDLRVATQLMFAEGRLAPLDVLARAASFTATDGMQVELPGMIAHWDDVPDLKRPIPATVTASAARIVHPKGALIAPTLSGTTREFPQVAGHLATAVAGEPIEVTFSGDAATRRGLVELRGRFGSAWLPEASRILSRDVTYYASITEAPDFRVRATLGEGGRWQRAEFRAVSGPIVARGVGLDRARVHGVVVPERVEIGHLEIAKGDQGAIGAYVDELATRQHRLLLRGSIRPLEISPWFSGWWERFWVDFRFDGPPPSFDIDVSGSWNIRDSDVVHGRGTARDGAMRGIAYDSLDTRFFVRANYYDLYQATITRPEGYVTGEVQLKFRRGQRDAERTSFAFESTADLVELARIFGSGGEALLEPYRYAAPPTTRVSGVVANDAGRFDTRLEISIESPAEFRYHDFPVAAISTEVKIHNNHVEIPRLVASYAGGTLRAEATADTGILDVKASLDGARYDDATGIFNAFLDRRSPPPPEESAPAGLAANPPGGILSLGIEARGPITTFDAYEGVGSLRISEANLGSVRIFGLLSDLMATINPRLGSLSFNEANTSFTIRRDRLAFPDMRITGRTAALESEGTYYINSRNLDFRARLYPLGESGGAITQLFDFVLGPVSYLLEMRLTGTLRRPNWSLSRMPFAPKPAVDEGTTAAPMDPATSPAPTPDAAAPGQEPETEAPPQEEPADTAEPSPNP